MMLKKWTVTGVLKLLPGKQAWNYENLFAICCEFGKTDRVPQTIPDVMSLDEFIFWQKNNSGLTGEHPTHSILGMRGNSIVLDFLLFFDLRQNVPQLMEPRAACFNWSGLQAHFPRVSHFKEYHQFYTKSTFKHFHTNMLPLSLQLPKIFSLRKRVKEQRLQKDPFILREFIQTQFTFENDCFFSKQP